MKPKIQFATTLDGVRIAFYTMGSGPPLVFDDLYSHIGVEWETRSVRDFVERVSTGAQVIRFDHRGTGLSDHGVDVTLDGWLLDIETVADKLGLATFVLFALRGANSPMAMHFAARYPDRVSHLIISYPRLRALQTLVDQARQLLAMPGLDWRSVSETYIRFAQGWDIPDQSREAAWRTQNSVSMDEFKILFELVSSWDAEPVLSQITAPTLLLASPASPPSLDRARIIASGLADAELFVGNEDEMFGAAARFLVERGVNLPAGSGARSSSEPRGTAIILFADIVDSTALTERMGDAAFRAKARELDDALRAIIRDNGGVAIDGKLVGDGVLATFPAASQAIAAALATEGAAEAAQLQLHLGIHAGDVIRESNSVFGGAVNIAARISALSAPGEVLVSRTVADLARTSAGVTFEDRGEHALKGIAEPQRVFAVRGSG